MSAVTVDTMGTIFGLLLMVGAVIHYFWWLVGAAVVLVGLWYGRVLYLATHLAAQAEARRQVQVRARADQQHAWAVAGDDRGTYGDYPPAAA